MISLIVNANLGNFLLLYLFFKIFMIYFKKTLKDVKNMFSEKLNEYISLIGCTGKEFAHLCNLSQPTLSRYKSGARTPKPNSEDIQKLCRGICDAANKKGIKNISYKKVLSELNSLADKAFFDFENLQTKFNMLCSVFGVNTADMAKSLKYDASYISRIKSGKRKPANPQKFACDAAQYFSKNFNSAVNKKIVAELLNIKPSQIKAQNDYISSLTNYLVNGKVNTLI